MLKSYTKNYKNTDYTIVTSCSMPAPKVFINYDEVVVKGVVSDLKELEKAVEAYIDSASNNANNRFINVDSKEENGETLSR